MNTVVGLSKVGKDGQRKSPEELAVFLRECVSAGMNRFDLADIYGGGRVTSLFSQALIISEIPRDSIEIDFKAGVQPFGSDYPGNRVKHYDCSAQHLHDAIDRFVGLPGIHYIDCFMTHRLDVSLGLLGMARVLKEISGRSDVGQIGVSNLNHMQLDLSLRNTGLEIRKNQINVSLLNLDALLDGSIDRMAMEGIVCSAWSPLGSGRVFHRERDDKHSGLMERLGVAAKALNMELPALALRFLISLPCAVEIVLGSGKIGRLKQQASWIQEGKLSRQEFYAVLEAENGTRVP